MTTIVSGTVRVAQELKARFGFEPLAGSRGEKELEGSFQAGGYRPVLEAFNFSELRLVATADHLEALSQLLEDGSVYAVSALARTALETSARAAWLLDRGINGRTRGLRGMAELLYAFLEETKFPIAAVQELARNRLSRLVSGAETADLEIERHPRTHRPLHFGEPRPDSTTVIRFVKGEAGEIAYRELSAVAHGNPTALVRQTDPVPDDALPMGTPLPATERVSLTRPVVSVDRVVPTLGVVWQAYTKAIESKISLFGWDATDWVAWRTEAGRELVRLLPSPR